MTATAAARSMAVAVFGFVIGLLFAAIAVPFVAQAQTAAAPPPKTSSVIVYGDDPCPQSAADEIVVCARQPESERYRIPKQFRGQKSANSPAGNSFANKVRATEGESRAAAGLPNTCSAIGSGGQTGCFLQAQQQAAQYRAQQRRQQEDSDDQP